MLTKHIIVSGKVQGVFFRKHTRDKARELNIKGWVRNLDNGTVEILASGEEDKVKMFCEWCKKGPEKARVDSVDVKEIAEVQAFKDFSIRY